jgi:hypothetical protein
MNVAWWLLIVVAAFASGALLGERDGASRADQRWKAATEKKRADGLTAARVVEVARFRNMEVAYRANQMENHKLRTAALAADRAARGLRDDLAAVRRALPGDAGTACGAALDACHAVLGDCGERYRDVAQAADDHAADARLCLEGWPQ